MKKPAQWRASCVWSSSGDDYAITLGKTCGADHLPDAARGLAVLQQHARFRLDHLPASAAAFEDGCGLRGLDALAPALRFWSGNGRDDAEIWHRNIIRRQKTRQPVSTVQSPKRVG